MFEQVVRQEVHGAHGGIGSEVSPIYDLGYARGYMEHLRGGNVATFVAHEEEVGWNKVRGLFHILPCHAEREAAFLAV